MHKVTSIRSRNIKQYSQTFLRTYPNITVEKYCGLYSEPHSRTTVQIKVALFDQLSICDTTGQAYPFENKQNCNFQNAQYETKLSFATINSNYY